MADVVWWEYEAMRSATDAVMQAYDHDRAESFVLDQGWDRQLRKHLTAISAMRPLHPIHIAAAVYEATILWAYSLGTQAAGVAVDVGYKMTASYGHIFAPIANEVADLLQVLHKEADAYRPASIARLADLVEGVRQRGWALLR